jgi:hypothetical protein
VKEVWLALMPVEDIAPIDGDGTRLRLEHQGFTGLGS